MITEERKTTKIAPLNEEEFRNIEIETSKNKYEENETIERANGITKLGHLEPLISERSVSVFAFIFRRDVDERGE